jgi:hypothetical protein
MFAERFKDILGAAPELQALIEKTFNTNSAAEFNQGLADIEKGLQDLGKSH